MMAATAAVGRRALAAISIVRAALFAPLHRHSAAISTAATSNTIPIHRQALSFIMGVIP